MWKLKIGAETVGEGGYQWLKSVNNHLGRQVWEFNPELGSPEELQRIEDARKAFWDNRFERRHSSDLLMRIQFEKENPCVTNLPQLKVKDEEEVTEEVVKMTLRRAISFYSTIQAHDGHWPGDYGGPMFLLPGLGYNGSQSWDTSFAVQAIISTNLAEEFGPTLRKAHEYIKDSQVLEDCPGDLNFWYRHISKGAWPFSIADHGWPSSDCTAEGLKAALLLSKLPTGIVGESLDMKRLYDAVNVTLSLQNDDGGFATYELTRSYQWLELINPAETFGDIVIDYP
ncbi:hypothetical protein GBA52_009380 [Prunus armeniaca]|nr:hypothetical protein GBA52_009380 [Prunus armeniaca]